MNLQDIMNKEMYFVHKGTWKDNYEWRIEKVKITGVRLDEKLKMFVEFSFSCTGYDYPLSYLKSTMKDAKRFAISQINKEKEKQINSINAITTV